MYWSNTTLFDVLYIYIYIYTHTYIHHSFISIQPYRPGWQEPEPSHCDPYGSGTLHPGQVLGGSLPLLSPAFRRSHFRRQVPVRPQEILAAKGGNVGEKLSGNFAQIPTST